MYYAGAATIPNELTYVVTHPGGALLRWDDGSVMASNVFIPQGTTFKGVLHPHDLIEVTSPPGYTGYINVYETQQVGPVPAVSGMYVGDGEGGWGPVIEHPQGCPPGFWWDPNRALCAPLIPPPPPPSAPVSSMHATGAEPSRFEELMAVMLGRRRHRGEEQGVLAAMFNPVGSRLAEMTSRRHYAHGYGGYWTGQEPVHPATLTPTTVRATDSEPTLTPVTTSTATAHPYAPSTGPTVPAPTYGMVPPATAPVHPYVPSGGMPTMAPSTVTPTTTPPTGVMPTTAPAVPTTTPSAPAHPAAQASSLAQKALEHAQTANVAATSPAAPGTGAGESARASATHATRAASHAQQAAQSPTPEGAQYHAQQAGRHARGAQQHAERAHAASRGGRSVRTRGGRSDWHERPEFAQYTALYGEGWWERPEFAQYAIQYGGEWWRRPEFATYADLYGEGWWERPEFAQYVIYYGGGEPEAPPPFERRRRHRRPWWRRPEFEGYERYYGREWWRRPEFQSWARHYEQPEMPPAPMPMPRSRPEVMYAPQSEVVYAAPPVPQAPEVVYVEVPVEVPAPVVDMIPVDMLPDTDQGVEDQGDQGEDAVQGYFAGWDMLFTDPYGRMNPSLPPAWDTAYLYTPASFY